MLLILAAALALVGAFAAGRWFGTLNASLERERMYPWPLHAMIAGADLRCEKFSANAGSFVIQTTDGGKTLIVGTLDRSKGMATVHAMDASGRVATDTVALSCP
jgi:hypothetical protein